MAVFVDFKRLIADGDFGNATGEIFGVVILIGDYQSSLEVDETVFIIFCHHQRHAFGKIVGEIESTWYHYFSGAVAISP